MTLNEFGELLTSQSLPNLAKELSSFATEKEKIEFLAYSFFCQYAVFLAELKPAEARYLIDYIVSNSIIRLIQLHNQKFKNREIFNQIEKRIKEYQCLLPKFLGEVKELKMTSLGMLYAKNIQGFERDPETEGRATGRLVLNLKHLGPLVREFKSQARSGFE